MSDGPTTTHDGGAEPAATGSQGTPAEASHDAVPHLEVDETVPPRPEEEIADVVRGTDATPPQPGDA